MTLNFLVLLTPQLTLLIKNLSVRNTVRDAVLRLEVQVSYAKLKRLQTADAVIMGG